MLRLINRSRVAAAYYSTSTTTTTTRLGIRAEDKHRKWERRAPLTPTAVDSLLSQHQLEIYVESDSRRIYSDHQYSQVRSPTLALSALALTSLSPTHTHTHRPERLSSPPDFSPQSTFSSASKKSQPLRAPSLLPQRTPVSPTSTRTKTRLFSRPSSPRAPGS